VDSRRSSSIVDKEPSKYQSLLATEVTSKQTNTQCAFVCFTAGVVAQNGHSRKGESRGSMYGDPGTPDINEVKQKQISLQMSSVGECYF